MSSVDKKRLDVVTYPEVIGLFITFLAVLYLLYPKAMFEKQVLAESSNYDLTATYLENMLRLDPSNKTLMLALAKTAQKSGKKDLALRLLDVLLKEKNMAMTGEVLELKYRLLRSDYPYVIPQKQAEIKEKLDHLLDEIMILDVKNIADKKYWYAEMLWHQKYEQALKLVKGTLEREPKSLFWMKQCYTVALKLKQNKMVQQCLESLLKTDKKEHEYWLVQAYYFALQSHNQQKVQQFLDELKHYSKKWTQEEAKLALQNGFYLQASDIYLKLSKGAEEEQERKKWFLEALSALQQGNFMKEAVVLVKEFEKVYLNDPEMIKIFLKLYLAAEDLESAAELSKVLLEIRGSK